MSPVRRLDSDDRNHRFGGHVHRSGDEWPKSGSAFWGEIPSDCNGTIGVSGLGAVFVIQPALPIGSEQNYDTRVVLCDSYRTIVGTILYAGTQRVSSESASCCSAKTSDEEYGECGNCQSFHNMVHLFIDAQNKVP